MRGFVRIGGRYAASLDAVERRIIAGVVADVAELLGTPITDVPGHANRGPSQEPGGPDAVVGWPAPWPSEAPDVPADPAVARLLPPASHDDGDLAAEFRRLTEADLRATKVGNLRLVHRALLGREGVLLVEDADAPRWAAALTDLRLVLSDRLGITTDDDAERVYAVAAGEVAGEPGDDVQDEVNHALATLYAALTWLQETLVQAMLDATPGGMPPASEGGDG